MPIVSRRPVATGTTRAPPTARGDRRRRPGTAPGSGARPWPGAVSGAGDAEREYNYGLTHIVRVALLYLRQEERVMTNPQEQLTELTRRTQENFKHLWEQWSQRSNELLKGVGSRSRSAGDAPGNPEEVLDAVFDFAENLIARSPSRCSTPPAGDSSPSPRLPTSPTPRPAGPGPPAWWAPRAFRGRQRLPALRRQEHPGADYSTAESPSLLRRPGITGLLPIQAPRPALRPDTAHPAPVAHPRQRPGW
jgi:hypothetical protein